MRQLGVALSLLATMAFGLGTGGSSAGLARQPVRGGVLADDDRAGAIDADLAGGQLSAQLGSADARALAGAAVSRRRVERRGLFRLVSIWWKSLAPSVSWYQLGRGPLCRRRIERLARRRPCRSHAPCRDHPDRCGPGDHARRAGRSAAGSAPRPRFRDFQPGTGLPGSSPTRRREPDCQGCGPRASSGTCTFRRDDCAVAILDHDEFLLPDEFGATSVAIGALVIPPARCPGRRTSFSG